MPHLNENWMQRCQYARGLPHAGGHTYYRNVYTISTRTPSRALLLTASTTVCTLTASSNVAYPPPSPRANASHAAATLPVKSTRGASAAGADGGDIAQGEGEACEEVADGDVEEGCAWGKRLGWVGWVGAARVRTAVSVCDVGVSLCDQWTPVAELFRTQSNLTRTLQRRSSRYHQLLLTTVVPIIRPITPDLITSAIYAKQK